MQSAKVSSKGLFVLSITFIVVSLIGFFGLKNLIFGIIWLGCGMAELIIAARVRTKETATRERK